MRVIASSTSYDSFGNAASSIPTSYQYTGREYDADTGLYYYRSRWYDPEVGRFISEDPIGFAGGDINLYSYVGNNPLSFINPYGNYACKSQEQKDCEKQIAAMFANPNAYFSDPNDGDTFDKALGFDRGVGRGGVSPENHLYASVTGRSKEPVSVYVPKGGKLVQTIPSIQWRESGPNSLALVQFRDAGVTVAIFHLDNLKKRKPGKDGRRRLGEIGMSRQGAIGGGSIIKNNKVVGQKPKFGHAHLEVLEGLHRSLPLRKNKKFVPISVLCKK